MSMQLTKLPDTNSNICIVCGSRAKWWTKDEANGRHAWFCESCLSDIKAVEIPTLDTTNHFMVSLAGDAIAVIRGIGLITKEEAVNLAAWLVVMSDVSDEDFEALVVAIRNS